MNIIKDSIKNNNALENFASNFSGGYTVGIISRTFQFNNTKNNTHLLFTIKNLKNIFYDLSQSEFYSGQKIAGSIKKDSFENSKQDIINCFFNKNAQIPTHKIDTNLQNFWKIIEHENILPPTDVYIHTPDDYSVFDFGIYWHFCYIYLNETTKKGIVIAASAWD